MIITSKQRRNAKRELTSIICAGCNEGKQRGTPFCRTCTDLLVSQGLKLGNLALITSNLKHTVIDYCKRLEFLLSFKGQKLRTARLKF